MARIQLSESVMGDRRITGGFLTSMTHELVTLYDDLGTRPGVEISIEGKRSGLKARRTDCTIENLTDGLVDDVDQVSITVSGVVGSHSGCLALIVKKEDPPFLFASGDEAVAAPGMRIMQNAFRPTSAVPVEPAAEIAAEPSTYAAADLRPVPVWAGVGAWLVMMAVTYGAMAHPVPVALVAASGVYAVILVLANTFLRMAPGPCAAMAATKPSASDDVFKRPKIVIDLGSATASVPGTEAEPAMPIL